MSNMNNKQDQFEKVKELLKLIDDAGVSGVSNEVEIERRRSELIAIMHNVLKGQ